MASGRGIVDTFHKASAECVPLYVAEFQFRYDNRRYEDIFNTVIDGCQRTGVLFFSSRPRPLFGADKPAATAGKV